MQNIMNRRDKEICGTFMVENKDKELIQVVVLQDNLSHYSKGKSYTKTLRLESPEGVIVHPTEDPDIFKLSNGTILKKKRFSSSFPWENNKTRMSV
jgi:hypothetical protein